MERKLRNDLETGIVLLFFFLPIVCGVSVYKERTPDFWMRLWTLLHVVLSSAVLYWRRELKLYRQERLRKRLVGWSALLAPYALFRTIWPAPQSLVLLMITATWLWVLYWVVIILPEPTSFAPEEASAPSTSQS